MATNGGSTLYNMSGQIQPDLANYEDSTASQFSLVYKPRYQLKIFKSKGAVVVLLWILCALFVLNFLISSSGNDSLGKHSGINPLVFVTISMLLYPVLGWLADVKYGRYVVVKWGLRVMWITSILFCMVSALAYYFKLESRIIKMVFFTVLSLNLGGVIANILQLGIDQLADASSREITAFLRWFLWLFFLSGILAGFSQSCLYAEYKFLFLPSVITVAVVIDCIFNHWLAKQPVSDNPFALIKKVLQYAFKNKYPRLRSALAYWDDKHYSRIDLAKSEFGGPFTIDQVEDVKTFFRILIIIITFSFFVGMYVSVYPMYAKLMSRLHNGEQDFGDISSDCFSKVAVYYSGSILLIIVLPIFEFVLYPLFENYFHVSILKKVGCGMVFFLLSLAACTAIEFVGNSHLPHANVTCPLSNGEHSSLPLDYKWMLFTFIANTIGQYLLISSAVEFLCAQSPHSMKGMLFGFGYGCIGFFTMLGYLLLMLVEYIVKNWLDNKYGCLSWHLLLTLAFLLTLLVIFFCVLECYKKRIRIQ